MMPDRPLRTGTLTQMVVEKYGGSHGAENLAKYIALTQVAASTGGANNIADVMVLGAWHSSGNLLEGFEVKVSRSDWLNEVKNPEKSKPTKQYCDKWWLVIANQDMVKEGELPEDWGMMTVVDGQLKVIKQAPRLESVPMSHDFVASLLRTDARGNIPLDVHNDQMKDYKRDIEAEYKRRYAGLLQFVKDLHTELGVDLANSGSKGHEDDWYARIGSYKIKQLLPNGGWNLAPDQLVAAIKIVLNGDLDTMKYRLDSLNLTAREIIKLTKDFEEAGDEE